MKKFFVALMMLAVFLTSSVALAAYEENVQENADLAAVKKIAIAYPSYYKVAETEPEIADLTRDLYNAGRLTSTREVVSYEDVAAAIRRDTGIDIRSLDLPEAEKVFKKYVSRYADAYVVTTFANNSNSPWVFFNVYNAADSELMYTYTMQSRIIGKNAKDYGRCAEQFFRQFDTATAQNLSKEERKALQKKQKELRAKKRKLNQVTYKTGRSKVDLVKKK